MKLRVMTTANRIKVLKAEYFMGIPYIAEMVDYSTKTVYAVLNDEIEPSPELAYRVKKLHGWARHHRAVNAVFGAKQKMPAYEAGVGLTG